MQEKEREHQGDKHEGKNIDFTYSLYQSICPPNENVKLMVSSLCLSIQFISL